MRTKLEWYKYWYGSRLVDKMWWKIAKTLPAKVQLYSLALAAGGTSINDNPVDIDKITYERMYKYLEGKYE